MSYYCVVMVSFTEHRVIQLQLKHVSLICAVNPSSVPLLHPSLLTSLLLFLLRTGFQQICFFCLTRWLHEEGRCGGQAESRGGRRRRGEPKQREMTVCLHRTAYYCEHSNL